MPPSGTGVGTLTRGVLSEELGMRKQVCRGTGPLEVQGGAEGEASVGSLQPGVGQTEAGLHQGCGHRPKR